MNLTRNLIETARKSDIGLIRTMSDTEVAVMSSDGSTSSIISLSQNTIIEGNSASVTEKNTGIDNKKKRKKLNIENGAWNCQYATCNDQDDSDMLKCSQCNSKFHYRCTDLPSYQIARFQVQGYRKYHCAGCVVLPKDLPGKCRNEKRTSDTLDIVNNSK